MRLALRLLLRVDRHGLRPRDDKGEGKRYQG